MTRRAAGLSIFIFMLVLAVLSALGPARTAVGTGPSNDVTSTKIWVYFKDHGEKSRSGLQRAISDVTLSPRSLERRRDRSAGPLTDVHDLAVSQDYLDALRDTGCLVRRTSKYLNAASVLATPGQVKAVLRLPFVKKVAPVRKYRRKALPESPEIQRSGDYPRDRDKSSPHAAVEYGPSYDQINQINVIPLHDAGIHGEGVLIAILDTGFNRAHEALIHLDVIAEWDFIFNDSVTSNEPEDIPVQHNHGTITLSAMAGYAPGKLIGPAWAATFILAKTERSFEEVQGEEDDYVRALEWADSIGALIVSSSLGYFDWYTWDDLDGNTAVTTIASDIAASKGITICTAAGNEGCCGDPAQWPGIIAPSDGDSVIAVGAVDVNGVVASFSSRGPSRDGRIKPDVMARGVSTYGASPYDSLQYTYTNGTSLSTPLVAGACALLVQMHPAWGPMDVLRELRNEASNSATPDNNYGWGIIDTYQSALYGATGILESVSIRLSEAGGVVRGVVTNTGPVMIDIDIARRRQATGTAVWGNLEIIHSIVVPGSSSGVFTDNVKDGGVYQYRVQLASDPAQVSEWASVALTFPFLLRQSAPNPFVAGRGLEAYIEYQVGGLPTAPDTDDISSYHEVRLEVFDVRGARVRTLFDGLETPGEKRRGWNGRDASGGLVSSGIYFYRLSVDGQSLTRKMVILRR